MKKIEFGFANEKNPTGSWQGTGINEGLAVTEAEYYGAVKFDGNSYIVAKVTEDKYGHYPNLVGKFIVRPAVADMYKDGSGIIFLDQEQSLRGQQLENFLNNEQFKSKINNSDDIVKFVKNGISKNDDVFDACTNSDTYVTTSIRHEEFQKKEADIAIKEQLKQDKNYLSQHFPQETVNEMLERRKKGLEDVERLEEFSRNLNEPSDKHYGYLKKEQVDEIVKTGKMPVTYEARKKKLLDAIEQDKITWEDEEYIREDLMADNDIRFALDHQYNKQSDNSLEEQTSKHTAADHFKDLSEYIEGQIEGQKAVKEANDVLDRSTSEYKTEQAIISHETKSVIGEAEQLLSENSIQQKEPEIKSPASFSSETQELLDKSQELLDKRELSPDYSVEQNPEQSKQKKIKDIDFIMR